MAHLVGGKLLIPGDAWQPVQAESTTATVMHHARPTRGYPEGRVRIVCADGTDIWWDVAKLPAEWVMELPKEPVTSLMITPRARRRSTAAANTTPGTTGVRRSSRRRSSQGQAVADGYDSSGAGLLSDGEGAPGAKRLSPAGPLTVSVTAHPADAADAGSGEAADEQPASGARRRSTRPRKSLRFAPGTVSPGARGVAYTAAGDVSPQAFGQITPNGSLPTSPLMSPRVSDAGGAAAAAEYSAAAPHASVYTSSPPRLSLARRVRNTLLIGLVMLPSLFLFRHLRDGCSEQQRSRPLSEVWRGGDVTALASSDLWCAVGYQQPLLAVNLMFFLNVDVLFWVIGLLQGSFWLIDPFWTIVPVLVGLFYQHHPAAVTQPLRSRLSMGLLWLWSARLTHSYFRREEWQVGAREDWRYSLLAKRLGAARWAVASFFAVGVAQQLMLVGITMPLLAIHTSPAPLSPLLDTLIFLAAATGIMTALVADNQLRDFVVANERRVAEGRQPILLLDTGLWRYSRHPNFFGEQLWWWSLGAWACVCGQPWMLAGAAFNTLCFIQITRMTEERMLARPERAHLYRRYQKNTSVWVPWFPREP